MTLHARLRNLIFASPVYGLTLTRRTPKEILGTPPDPWPGNGDAAEALLASGFSFRAGSPRPSAGPWYVTGGGATAAIVRHRFSWLRDLRTLGSDDARLRARALVAQWIHAHAGWDEIAWRPDVLGSRLTNWLTNFGFLTSGSDEAFRAALLTSAARQAQHLKRVLAQGDGDVRRLRALKGAVYAGICLPGAEGLLAAALAQLSAELGRQILPDGGHYQRCPTIQLEVLRDLIDIRSALAAAHRESLPAIQSSIDRMAPLARTLRHGDGRMALFNGSNAEDERDVGMILAQSGARGRALLSAPHSGFHRLAAGRTVVLADLGAPPPPGADRRAHASTLSFEMGVGKDRLIVNCGHHGGEATEWRMALAATAAHSTVTVNDANSSELRPAGGLGRRPQMVTCARREAEGNIWIEACHDGYEQTQGVTHRRELYLAHDGADFRGQDQLISCDGKTGGGTFAVRFHLHPQVQSSLVQGGTQVLLKLPTGRGWRFIASGGTVSLEDSIYLGNRQDVRRSRQIVISGVLAPAETTVKWALHQEAK